MALDFLSPLHKASRQISVYLEGRTRELALAWCPIFRLGETGEMGLRGFVN